MLATQFDNDTRKLMSGTDVFGLDQLLTEQTKVTETAATLMDLIFVNCPEKVVCSDVLHARDLTQ